MTNEELEQEYQKFQLDFNKACKDMSDAISKLSPANLERFKSNVRQILPIGLKNLIEELYSWFLITRAKPTALALVLISVGFWKKFHLY